jgi:hypothetical protein
VGEINCGNVYLVSYGDWRKSAGQKGLFQVLLVLLILFIGIFEYLSCPISFKPFSTFYNCAVPSNSSTECRISPTTRNASGGIWWHLVAHGGTWWHLAASGSIWQHRNIWQQLAAHLVEPGHSWSHLKMNLHR